MKEIFSTAKYKDLEDIIGVMAVIMLDNEGTIK